MTPYPILASLALVAAATPAAAQPARHAPERFAVTLAGFDVHPATPAAADRAVARIDRAALEVCGAARSSLRPVKLAVRRSACWKDAIADVRRALTDPLLLAAWQRRF